jgi:hypothetical protein
MCTFPYLKRMQGGQQQHCTNHYENLKSHLKNDWITQGIKISCKHKRNLYIHRRNNNDKNKKAFYIKCCKILNNAIKEAKSSISVDL